MKKAFLYLVMLCLALTAPAHAAPTRNLTTEARDHQELITQVQPLADAVAAAAITQGIFDYQNGLAPEAAFAEGLLYQALRSHMLVVEAIEGVLTLSREEAMAIADRLFYHDNLPVISTPVAPGVTLEGDSLRFDISRPEDFVGTHIYDITVNEEELLVRADIYRLNGIVASALEAPEGSLSWLGHTVLRMKPEADSAVGFALTGFSVTERYQQSSMVQFVQKDLFELQYPDFFSEDLKKPDAFLSVGSPDNSAGLTVKAVPGTLESILEVWRKEGQPLGKSGSSRVENQRAMYTAPGLLRLAYFDPQNGQDLCLVVEMTYPPEKEFEFSLYQTFLDNSFVVYSHASG